VSKGALLTALSMTNTLITFFLCDAVLMQYMLRPSVCRSILSYTQPFYCSAGICPGPSGWAGTRKVKPGRLKPIWIYWRKRQCRSILS